jgi:hypothetical protein
MAVGDPLTARSRVATAIVLTLAVAAFGLTVWYVAPGLPYTLIGLSVAAVLLGGPLATRWPITPRRAFTSSAVWFLFGLPASYVFGTFVMYASLLLALSVAGLVLQPTLHRRLRSALVRSGRFDTP